MTTPAADAPTMAGTEMPPGTKIGPMLVVAVLIGIAGALAASVFLGVESWLQDAVWTELPQKLNLSSSLQPWYVLLMLLIGAGVVLIAQKLPGATGGGPLEGFHFNVGPGTIASVALAALGTLVFGMVLGPEMPLIACGTAIGGLLMRGRGPQAVQLGMLLGGVAGIGAIFGNPLITAFMILEFAALGPLPAAALIPVLVALGSGYLVQTGVGRWSGLGTHTLSVPGLPAYTSPTVGEIIGAIVVGAVAAIVALLSRELGERVATVSRRRPTPVLFGAAILTGLLAIAVHAITGQDYDVVLFSGESALGTLLSLTSVGTLVLIVVAKLIAYALALGGGFRGGPIFPAVTLGVAVGMIAYLLVPGLTIPGMAAAAIAATVAAMTKLPFTGTMLGVLLIASAGATVTPLAIIGGIIGFIARVGLDKFDAKRGGEGGAAPAPAAA